jgi:hypothetical protein
MRGASITESDSTLEFPRELRVQYDQVSRFWTAVDENKLIRNGGMSCSHHELALPKLKRGQN